MPRTTHFHRPQHHRRTHSDHNRLVLVGSVITGGGRGWDRPFVVTGLTVGGLGLAAFVLWQRKASAPMLPLRLLRHRGFVTASVASLLMYSASFGTLFLLTQLLQTGLGASPLEAGLRTLPMAVMPLFLAPVGGILCDRIGNRPVMITAWRWKPPPSPGWPR